MIHKILRTMRKKANLTQGELSIEDFQKLMRILDEVEDVSNIYHNVENYE